MLDDEISRCLLQWVSRGEEKEDAGWGCSAEMLKILIRYPGCLPEGSAMRRASIPTHLFLVNFSSLSRAVSYLDVYLGVPIPPHLTLANQSVCYTQDIVLSVNK